VGLPAHETISKRRSSGLSALQRKLLRDLSRQRGPALAIALVVACATACFVAMQGVYLALEKARIELYETSRFADLFVQVKSVPEQVVTDLGEIPDVSAVQSRIVQAVRLRLDGYDDSISGTLIGEFPTRPTFLNQVVVLRGSIPRAINEVLVHQAFAHAHHLEPGAEIHAVLNGKEQSLIISGFGMSAEHIAQVSGTGIFPDDLRTAVVWGQSELVTTAFDLRGTANTLALRLAPSASRQHVLARVKAALEPYGILHAHDRDLQLSYRNLRDELEQLRAFGIFAPLLFLAVAAYLLNIVAARIVGTQRESIAALKALGYTSAAIARHYFLFVTIIVVIGSLVGSGLGAWMGEAWTNLYDQFFHLPNLRYEFEWSRPLGALTLNLIAGLAGAALSIYRAVSISPAQAMRPPAPARFRHNPFETFVTRLLALGPSAKMALRLWLRRPIQAILATFAMAASVTMIIAGTFSQDSLAYMMEMQFGQIAREDMAMSLMRPAPLHSVADLRIWPGVLIAEGSRIVPVELIAGPRRFRTALQGVSPNAVLRRTLDANGKVIEASECGLSLSRELARLLNVSVGEMLEVSVLEGRRQTLHVPICDLVDDLLGVSATLPIVELANRLDEEPSINQIFLRVDSSQREALRQRFEPAGNIIGISQASVAVAAFEKQVADVQTTTRVIISLFAACIAFGVVYNTIRIALAEQARDLGTLRVLGFSTHEVWLVLVLHFSFIWIAALPIGCVMGHSIAQAIVEAATSDLFRFPLVINPSSYANACLQVSVAAGLTCLLARRKIAALDLVAVLKARD
jgi:putative ABC transport system permease protein